jgi:PAS domain-containing protein
MYARTSAWTGSVETIERWAEHVQAHVRPMVEQLPGNAGAFFFVDRAGGRALTLTLWEDEVAAVASDATAEQSREKTIAATGVELAERGRWELARDVFEPLGLEDELRAVLRTRGNVWGFLCLHRKAGSRFSSDEAGLIRRLAPVLAEGKRLGLLVQSSATDRVDGPGVVVLSGDGSMISANTAAERWLDDLRGPTDIDLPIEIRALAARLRDSRQIDPHAQQLRVRTRAGRWAVLHASWMAAADHDTVAVILEEARPEQLAPIVMNAYGLTHGITVKPNLAVWQQSEIDFP